MSNNELSFWDKKDILDSARKIRDFCKGRTCDECPLKVERANYPFTFCGLRTDGHPSEWNI